MAYEASADRLAAVLVRADATIAHALAQLDAAGTGVLLVADEQRRLIGTLTDGDVRRALLAATPLDAPCGAVACRTPLVATPDTSERDALALMNEGRSYIVNHLPVVNPDGAAVGLLLRSDLGTSELPALSAVVMAGGYGTRLRPLTDHTPKPMLPVGDRPLLEHTIERLRRAGIRRVHVTTHYRADAITSHFGDGAAFGVELRYVAEDRPLGTAGSLRCLRDLDGPVLVLNGDVLTGVPFHDMLAFHREHGAVATVGVREYDMQVPYGVVECDGVRVRGVHEKPTRRFLVNAGVYLMEPSVHAYIPPDVALDMPDLIQRLVDAGHPVVVFPIVEYWLDIGRPADYERAQADIKTARL